MAEREGYPLYGSTFTLYRASPLYHGSTSLFTNLHVHSRRLRETLAGDSSRRIQDPEFHSSSTSSGSLESCEWSLLGDEETWESAQEKMVEEEAEIAQTVSPEEARGIHVLLRYEKAKYVAVLLGESSRASSTPGFSSLPLLLVRMPAPLREVFVNFLTTSFDARISPMRLRPSFLTAAAESILDKTTATNDEDPSFDLETLTKGVALQLSFPSVSPHLKNLDISIPKDDIRGFLARGKQMWQQHQTRQQAEARWHSRPHSAITGPFTAALSTYLDNHIAMSLDNPGVSVSKVAIGPFALASEGKVKVLGSSSVAVGFWESLVQEARGVSLEAFDKVAASTTQKEVVEERQPRPTVDRLPTEPPPPYELHDPARR